MNATHVFNLLFLPLFVVAFIKFLFFSDIDTYVFVTCWIAAFIVFVIWVLVNRTDWEKKFNNIKHCAICNSLFNKRKENIVQLRISEKESVRICASCAIYGSRITTCAGCHEPIIAGSPETVCKKAEREVLDRPFGMGMGDTHMESITLWLHNRKICNDKTSSYIRAWILSAKGRYEFNPSISDILYVAESDIRLVLLVGLCSSAFGVPRFIGYRLLSSIW